ncbi:hypothetical protein [Actinomadura rudentiformis]|uniref:Secreted protein n=1 Tax=Actinomadura rudentiformis TaxID=359158 RepID=A0A6H9YX11_9ACTN|nr:hypothetical protein [Actinomadura rudentiformis]KAB2349478.1 hypothetical protein F8566_11880 [Actinomadura rudentiformis]
MRTIQRFAIGACTGIVALTSFAGTASAGTGADTVTVRSESAAAPKIIKCRAVAHNPHYSHHAHAADKHRVNIVGTVKCDKKVAKLRIKVVLYKGKSKNRLYKYKESAWKTNYGKSSINHNAARRCVKKQYYKGVAFVQVVFPPGYKPPAGSAKPWSKTVYISACKKQGS